MRFAGAPDLPASGAVNEYRGLALTGVASQRYTFDANHSLALPGTLDRTEGQSPTGDADVDQAHDFASSTYGYFVVTHGRDSYDSLGGAITSTAHYGTNYLNAFWNGDQMVYGDGFAVNDVVAHELTHAVIEHSPALEYQWQSGALNESFADIFAAMVDRDDWLIGEDLPPGALAGRDAIRDMSNPTRFDQPDNTSGWRTVCSDNEGVHSNSGITNKAFYNVATSIGKEKAEQIFYRALTVHLLPTASLEDLRAAALEATHELSQSLGYSNTYQTTYSLVQSGFDSVGLDGYWQPPTNDCVCGASVALIDAPDGLTLLGNLRAARDALSVQDPGRRWTDLYYGHQFEVASLLLQDSQLRQGAQLGLLAFDPVVRALLDEAAPTVTLTPALIRMAEDTLTGLAREGSDSLRADIYREWEETNPYRFAGWDVRRVRQQLIAEAAGHKIYLPLVTKYADKQ